jgi:RNA:NAD 2'-phosphotransferase (TPT1/KptA family)
VKLIFLSDIRQVPDNQEVYLDANGFSSIVVEILEHVEKPDAEALEYHLQDLVDEDEGETKVWKRDEGVCSRLP